jgi:hypothetical protein
MKVIYNLFAMNVRIVLRISLARARPVIPILTKNPVMPVSGNCMATAKTKINNTRKISFFII